MKNQAMLSLILVIGIVLVSGCTADNPQGPGDLLPDPTEIVPAPQVEGKIKGYWSSRSNMVISELDDVARMKDIGINTITFSPALSHTQEGTVTEEPGTEAYIKNAINKVHAAGFRVFLETTPMNAGNVAPKVTDVDLFQRTLKEFVIKYATIAEEYNVEYFAPIVEPVHHMSVEEADEWLQEILPDIKAVYSGPVAWKKQEMHIANAKEWDQDHIMTLGFKLDSFSMQMNLKTISEHNILLQIKEDTMSLEEYEGDGTKFKYTESLNLDSSIWHTLRVEIEGQEIRISMDDELIITHDDDSGPMGGYSLSADSMRINRFEVTDMDGTPLLVEDFTTLNNWNAKSGWALGNNEIVVTENTESALIHDIDFSGYDYIAIDTFKRGQVQTNQEYIDNLEFVVDKTNDQAESDGVPYVIIAEFGGSILEEIGWIDADERAKIPMTVEELVEVSRMVLEMAENKVDGYMYNGWDIEGQGINALPEIEALIKEWYNSH
ncbi:MAG: glycoside hydrolase family 113 [Candidatus Thorarchaeota archaeon]|jgi:hypothetical protein